MGISKLATYAWEFDNSLTAAVGGVNLTGSPTYGTGKISQAMTNGEVESDSSLTISSGTKWSASFWVKDNYSDASAIFGAGTLLVKHSGDGENGFYIMKSGVLTGSSVTGTQGQWQHFLVSYNAGTISWWRDGGAASGSFSGGGDSWAISGTTTVTADTASLDQLAILANDNWDGDDAAYIYNSGSGRAYADWEVSAPPATPSLAADELIALMIL